MNNAAVLWRGPSAIDGVEVALVVSGLTEPSANTKTGDMIQTWVMRTDMHPVEAKLTGQDTTICGDCPLASGYGCYVNVHWAPAALWRELPSMPELGVIPTRGRPVRVGAYGDPSVVPIEVWQRILPRRWTGFTHRWREQAVQPFRAFCMASTEDTASTREAWAKGWRTFRLRPAGTPLLSAEIDCVERTHGIQCADCALCRGNRLGAKSVSIEAHGTTEKMAASVSRGLELIRAGQLSSA
jgi:hypothetical protein